MNSGQFHFYVCRKGQPMPSYTCPAFLLCADGWDDYGTSSRFLLKYVPDYNNKVDVGNVKIIVKPQEPGSIGNPKYTADYIPQSFTSISEFGEGCSLGQEKEYYLNLLKIFKTPDDVLVFLNALSDCALFHGYYESMYNHPCFYSLTRYDTAEQLRRTARLLLYQQSPPDLYQMEYSFYTPYNENERLHLQFEFDEKGVIIPRRIYAIIGENGTGKTSLLNQLTLDFLGQNNDAFKGERPPYSKIIRVSTSIYDDYAEPELNNTCEFAYSGIRHHELEGRTMREVLNVRIQEAIKMLKKEKYTEDGEAILYKLLRRFMADDILREVYNGYKFDDDKDYTDLISRMSSGESNMFFMLADVLAQIKYNTLLLFDEPELHMHPNAVTLFMDILYSMLEDYQSFAIIATHSPLIVRELLGENVYVLEKNDNTPIIRKIGMESFAANLTDLYEEIFSNKDTKHYYESILENLYNDKMTYEEVKSNLRSQHLEPNMNMRLLIMNIFAAGNEED